MLSNVGTNVIETERLVLRGFEFSDSSDMLEYWVSDPEIQSLYSEPVYTTDEEVHGLLTKIISSYKNDHCYRWAIVLKDTNKCIGQIAYFLIDDKNHFGEIEYCIGSCFQRLGHATEATKAIIEYGFERINLHKIQVCHKESNEPSRKLILACGFKYEGTLRDYFYVEGQYIDRLYYSMLRHEYLVGIEK